MMTKQRGFTLIEIMLSLTLGLIIIGATLSLYLNTIRSGNDTIQAAQLNHDLESAMSLMMNDIKRAGFWGGAVIDVDSRLNPFTATTGTISDIKIRNLAAPTTAIPLEVGNCILYSYDADSDGITESNEFYGFRLNGTTIQIRTSGATTNDCTDGAWQEFVLGTQLDISAIQFSLLPLASAQFNLAATTRCLNYSTDPIGTFDTTCTISVANGDIASGNQAAEKRTINIVITGELDNDDTVTKTLTGSVQVRNDRLFNQP